MLTDNETIKALECCGAPYNRCLECPLCEMERVKCFTELTANALDLNNRQKAEIERLTDEKENLRCVIEDLSNNTEYAKVEAYKEIAESVKIKTLAMVHSPGILTTADYIKCIDDIVKEWVGENND